MSAMIIRLPNAGQDKLGDNSLRAELRRARVRIAQLESSLQEAQCDNLANFNRAREAEKRLADLEG